MIYHASNGLSLSLSLSLYLSLSFLLFFIHLSSLKGYCCIRVLFVYGLIYSRSALIFLLVIGTQSNNLNIQCFKIFMLAFLLTSLQQVSQLIYISVKKNFGGGFVCISDPTWPAQSPIGLVPCAANLLSKLPRFQDCDPRKRCSYFVDASYRHHGSALYFPLQHFSIALYMEAVHRGPACDRL